MKFGGTCLSNVNSIFRVAKIVGRQQEKSKVLVVVSGCAGVTDKLTQLLSLSVKAEIKLVVENLYQQHVSLCLALAKKLHAEEEFIPVLSSIKYQFERLERFLINPEYYYHQIITLGERLSAQLILGVFNALSLSPHYLNATDYIKVEKSQDQLVPLYKDIRLKCQKLIWLPHSIFVTEGFIALDEEDLLTNLGRNGSDWSAALFAISCDAIRLEIWKDVYGLYTADPQVVSEPNLIPHINFKDLSTLSKLGAAVIHSPALDALSENKLTLELKCILAPEHDGTQILFCDFRPPIKIISSLTRLHLEQKDNQLDIYSKDKGATELRLISSGPLVSNASLFRWFYQQEFEVSLIAIFDNDNKIAPDLISQILDQINISVQQIVMAKFDNTHSFIVARKDSVKVIQALHFALIEQGEIVQVTKEEAKCG